MRRWKVVVYDMVTGEHSLPDRFFRFSRAQICADRCNARFSLRPDEAQFRAMIIDTRFERKVIRQRRLSCRT